MDDFSNENLKQVFGKLQNYETKRKGLEWSQMQSLLNGGDQIAGKALAVSLIFLGAFISSGTYYQAHDRDGQNLMRVQPGLVSIPNHAQETVEKKDNKSVQKTSTALGVVDKPIMYAETLKSLEEAPATVELNNEEEQMLLATPDVGPADSEPEISEDANLVSIAEQNEGSAAMPVPVDEEKESDESEESKGFYVTFSGGYLMGIVQPLPHDSRVLDKYTFKPGFTLNTELMFPITTLKSNTLYAGIAYSVLKKDLDYIARNIGPESIEIESVRSKSLTHQVGLGLNYHANLPNLTTGITLYRSLKSDLVNHVGKTALAITIRKGFELKNNFQFHVGATAMTPVSGKIETFKYFPIQLQVGIRKSVFRKSQ